MMHLLWWDVDRKLSTVLNMNDSPLLDDSIDLYFVSETCLGTDALPGVDGNEIMSDPTVKLCTHGGMAWYVRNSLYNHICQVTYGISYIALSFDVFPTM